ncbi:hypothetical protein VOLCADRAFT_89938 [Volvox carteri f. nagariensis]|uniref:Tbc2 translation factor, chloroplastic n=1 Tax=Volvox carteri f. nagariensis TaxID=3068 RepID=D8TT22_VOLCA|nr:uncharacterized protein VOLCADRAFT_89938 [Volvox carteri f. nagariensis]EFJ49580.1 hypothetical protein VOLCADRAFT_89938 [Volvox carteri f. nagariensis]|eukprot:XP_002949561.1 hypothetical protein VOLCADRAFT_89938 [Volvox carteri f. nagariensis]
MRTLGRHLSRRSRPHFPQACPFSHYRGRRRGLAILAGAPPLPSVSSGVDNPPRRARQVQLVWNASSQQPSRPSVPSHHQDTQAGALQQSLQLPRSQHLQQYRNTDPRVIFLQRLEHAVVAHLPHFEGRQLANTLWAMAKLGHRPSEKWLEVMLTRASSQLHTFNPQHLANTLYALMLLRYMPPPAWLEDFYSAVGRRLHGFGPGELSHLCYAAGKLGLQPGRELLGGVLHHSLMHMQAYGVRELALLAYGVVHMGARLHADWLRVYRKRVTGLVIESGALPARFLERLAEQLGQQQQLDLAELARAQLKMRQQQLSQQQYPPGQHQQYHIHHTTSEQHHEQQHQQELGLMEHGSSHVWPSVTRGDGLSGGTGPGAASTSSTNPESLLPPSFSSSPVDNSIDSIMATTISVATVAPAAAWAPVSASPRAARVASYLPTVLCSLAEVGYRPPSIFLSTVLAAVGSCAGQLTPVGLTTVLLSLANMRYRPHPALFWRVWSLLMNSLESLETQQCTVAIWASAILGCDAPRGDVAAILANAAARLPDHSDRELLQLLEAVSALGFEPTTSWLELLESDLYNRLPRMEPPQVAALLLPLAGLGHKPHRLWMARWAEAMAAGLPELGLRHMAAAAYGAARLGFRPPSRLCGELLAATAAELGSTATAAVEATAAQQQQQQDGGKQQQLSRLGGRQGDEPKLPHRARSAWERRHGDRAHSSRHLPETLSRLLWALAVLDIRPDAGWLSSYMECLGFMREDLSSQERVKVVWALARFRYNPGPEWAQDLALWRDEARLQQQQEGLLPHSGRGSIGAGEPAAPVMALDTRGNDVGAAAAATAEAAALRRHDNGVRDSSAAAAAIAGSAAATHVALTIDNLTAGTAGAVSEVGTANLADTQAPMVHCVDHDSSSKSSISKSNGGSSLDVNTFVLQGIHEWASRQLSDPESSARPRRGRRRLVRGVR